MARKFLTPIDLAQNELQNARVQNLAAAPSSPVVGQIYYNTSTGRIEFRGASAWIDPTARANHTGTQLAATISDFDTQVRTSRLDQMASPTASVSLNSQKITNLLDGASAQDAATYGQLLAVQQGRSFKDAVRIATTANITLSGLQTIDGVTTVAGDRVLVKDQSTGSQNGIYLAASGAWTRATDADTSAKLGPNTTVLVSEGTANADKIFTMTTNAPITLGTTSLAFAQTGSGGTTYSQGTGITISGATISTDSAVTPRGYASTTVGDGASTSIAITHSLGTLKVIVQVYQNSDGATVECDVTRNSTSQVTLGFASAPASNSLSVVIYGIV